ncbi:hypothetical protein [Fimbriiglobus ruber]|uniref:Uncharacterized protein n=1 Tax=Fimbriiglobus ruber TaxID=1908690 RepID=A0A225DW18_9BACT|nr:hypothetical protein [Fimbriiglobus ruber]OWK40397.1 hypothetical protein FRUB_05316 [Fimbriiglobus ruber]
MFPGRAKRWPLVALAAACVAGVAVNPYHVRLFGVVWEYATQTGPLRGVQELAPPDPAAPWAWVAGALLAWAGVVVVRRRPVDGFAIALLVGGLFFSLRMRRDVWFASVVALTVLRDSGEVIGPRMRTLAVVGIVAATFLALHAIQLAGLGPPADPGAANTEIYPSGRRNMFARATCRGRCSIRSTGVAISLPHSPSIPSRSTGGRTCTAAPA